MTQTFERREDHEKDMGNLPSYHHPDDGRDGSEGGGGASAAGLIDNDGKGKGFRIGVASWIHIGDRSCNDA
mgnify:CR=1 FL=1